MTEFQKWTFDAIDSLFFRESRQMDTIGGTGLNSIFPPSPYTLAGAIRSYIGNCYEIDWAEFRNHKESPIENGIKLSYFLTTTTDFKEWSIEDYFITIDDKRLYPIPLFVLNKGENWTALEIPEEIIRCDLGNVRLPSVPSDITEGGYKPIENAYVTEDIYQKFLNSEKLANLKQNKDFYKTSDLYTKDERLGISIDNKVKATIDGMLYQTQHLRLKDNVKLCVITKNLNKVLRPQDMNGVIRLGGEGRIAGVSIEPCSKPQFLKAKDIKKYLIITLTTTADFKESWFFPNFSANTIENKQDVWEGKINDVQLRIHACVLGKIQREGGWEKKSNESGKGKPRQIKTLIPAGSAYYCEILDENLNDAISKLEAIGKIGVDTPLGRGCFSIGLWK